jgi:hypothetical protein
MEEAPENGKESSHSAHAKEMNKRYLKYYFSTHFAVRLPL